MYHFQLQRSLDQNQFWLLFFSGKKGRRTGWISALSHPLSHFGYVFFGMALFCRLEFERQSWFFSPRSWQDSPWEIWPCGGHGCRKLFHCYVAELGAQPAHAGTGHVGDEERGGVILSLWTNRKKREQTKQEHFLHRREVWWCGNLSSSLVGLHVTAPWKSALPGTKHAPH